MVKDAPAEQLIDGIRRVHQGLRVVDPSLAAASLSIGASPLTAREREVLGGRVVGRRRRARSRAACSCPRARYATTCRRRWASSVPAAGPRPYGSPPRTAGSAERAADAPRPSTAVPRIGREPRWAAAVAAPGDGSRRRGAGLAAAGGVGLLLPLPALGASLGYLGGAAVILAYWRRRRFGAANLVTLARVVGTSWVIGLTLQALLGRLTPGGPAGDGGGRHLLPGARRGGRQGGPRPRRGLGLRCPLRHGDGRGAVDGPVSGGAGAGRHRLVGGGDRRPAVCLRGRQLGRPAPGSGPRCGSRCRSTTPARWSR